MEKDKAAFLYGQPPAGAGPDDPEARAAMLSQLVDEDEGSSMPGARRALYEVVVRQVAEDDPPEVWETAKRLFGLGLDRRQVFNQLVMTLLSQAQEGLAEDRPYDRGPYAAALAALPLPGPDEVTEALLTLARELQPVDGDELLAKAAEALGASAEQEPHQTLLDGALQELIEDGSLAYLVDDKVVEPASYCARSVLTHRLSEAERAGGYLDLEADVPVFSDAETAEGPGGVPLEETWQERVGFVWRPTAGPTGWLEEVPAGSVLAVSWPGGPTGGHPPRVEVVYPPPVLDEAAIAALREAYERAVAEPGLPVATKELVLEMISDDPRFFERPRPPLDELIA
ncbi:MAG: hypothetical protein ACRDZX_12285, partial [Acidimicrobiales bacterium]